MVSFHFRTSSCVDGVVATPRRRDAVDAGVRASARIVGVVATVSIHAGADERHLRLRRGLRVGPRLWELRPAPVQHVGLDGAAALPGLRDEGHGSGSGGRPESEVRVYRGRFQQYGGRDSGSQKESWGQHFVSQCAGGHVHERSVTRRGSFHDLPYAIFMNRLRQTRSRVVRFSILSLWKTSGPSRRVGESAVASTPSTWPRESLVPRRTFGAARGVRRLPAAKASLEPY